MWIRSGLNNSFRAIVDGLGIRGMPRVRRLPRPHDLRHTFAVHRLLRWYREGADVQSKLPAVSLPFMGHIDPTSTQVYLTITAALLEEANARFHRSFRRFLRSGKTPMTDSGYLAPFIRSFFEDHLTCRRNVSRNTIQSYRDGLKLLLAFAAEQRKRPATRLLVRDITEEIVISFLSHLEKTRANSIQTRNHRLVAIQRLFDYIAAQQQWLLDQCHRIATIPRKRGIVLPEIHYLEKEQLTALLDAIPKDSARTPRLHVTSLHVQHGCKSAGSRGYASQLADTDCAVQS